jgi:hypothetical protein
MTGSNSTPIRNNFENDIIEIPLSFDIQSQHNLLTDTNINPSSNVSNPFPHNQIISSCACRSGDVKEK